jgi:hypothetical protein
VSLWLTVTLLSFQWKLCFPAPEARRYVRLVLGEPEAHRYVRRQRREMKEKKETGVRPAILRSFLLVRVARVVEGIRFEIESLF